MDNITFEQLPQAFRLLFAKVENIERLLEVKQKANNTSDELLIIGEAASFLKLSIPTIYGLVSKSQLPYNKKGKRLYFSKQELTAWIKEGRRKTITEIQEQATTHQTRRRA